MTLRSAATAANAVGLQSLFLNRRVGDERSALLWHGSILSMLVVLPLMPWFSFLSPGLHTLRSTKNEKQELPLVSHSQLLLGHHDYCVLVLLKMSPQLLRFSLLVCQNHWFPSFPPQFLDWRSQGLAHFLGWACLLPLHCVGQPLRC